MYATPQMFRKVFFPTHYAMIIESQCFCSSLLILYVVFHINCLSNEFFTALHIEMEEITLLQKQLTEIKTNQKKKKTPPTPLLSEMIANSIKYLF